MKTIACIGTGPSLRPEQIQVARDNGWPLYGCNNAFQVVPDLSLLYAVNLAWWDHYWPEVESLSCEKWTTNAEAAQKYGINWIAERNAPCMSRDPGVIHHGHGSGYSLVSMAYRAGAERVILLGYDLAYAKDYDGKARQIGSTPRHFFGEYPEAMRHWPSVQVHEGVHAELIALYESIDALELVNCSPGSALLPVFDIRDV